MKLRVLLIGFGEMGRQFHLPTLRSAGPSVEVVGLVRKSRKPAEELPDVPVFEEIAAAAQSLKPDLAVISTPHALHAAQVRCALESGCHVFVEKPLALDFKEASDLVSLAKTRDRLLVVGLQRRYEGLCSIIRELKTENRLGSILYAHGLFAHTFGGLGPTGWRMDSHLSGAGILDDSAYHVLDVLLVAAGGEIKQLAGCHVLHSESGIPHSFSAIFEMTNGAMITASGSYASPRQSVQEEISILGSAGSIFGRRFCREWNTDPPQVYYKSRDGSSSKDFDLQDRPSGRALPLKAMLSVLLAERPRTALLSEAGDTLTTHRAVALIKSHLT